MTMQMNLMHTTFVQSIAARLFRNGSLTTIQAAAIAEGMYASFDFIGQPEFEVRCEDAIDRIVIVNSQGQHVPSGFNFDNNDVDFMAEFVKAGLLTADGKATEALETLGEQGSAYFPTVKGQMMQKRFNKNSKKWSRLMKRAINVLENTYYTVDTTMLTIARKVFADESLKCTEDFIIKACCTLVADGNPEVSSEFKPDLRGRLYQAACHGANGQSSDMARSFMDLAGVPTNYDAVKAKQVLIDEMADMCKGDVIELYNFVLSHGSVKTVQDVLKYKAGVEGEYAPEIKAIKKPWSFVKGCFILKELLAGNKPYIGMAFGLDAKCSGPQLGALMTGDSGIAAACGFASVETKDAYLRCMALLEKAGYLGLDRDTMKKPFMGVFYGQGMRAFCNAFDYEGNVPANVSTTHSKKLFDFVVNMGCEITNADTQLAVEMCNEVDGCTSAQLVANARVFHETIESSFGNMKKVRELFKSCHGKFDKEVGDIVYRTSETKSVAHFMPDGFSINMNEKLRYDYNMQATQKNDCDSIMINGVTFEKFSLQSDIVDRNYARRTGFVNLIQGTDALLARLITANLGDDNAMHVVAVHDCFRVNICDMIDGKLHKAIALAYAQIFTDIECEWFVQKIEGVNPRDILGNYFEGVKHAYSDNFKGMACMTFNQFTKRGKQIYTHVEGVSLTDLINNLENKIDGTGASYYFAK